MNRLYDPKYWLRLIIPQPVVSQRISHTKYDSVPRETILDNSYFPGMCLPPTESNNFDR